MGYENDNSAVAEDNDVKIEGDDYMVFNISHNSKFVISRTKAKISKAKKLKAKHIKRKKQIKLM